MVQVPATIGRAKLEQTASGLRVAIPAYRNLYNFWDAVVVRPLLGLFLLPAMWKIFADSPAFMAVITIVVVLGVTLHWGWKGRGQEIITVNRVAFTLRWEIGGIGWNHRYFLEKMSHLRFSTSSQRPGRNISDWNYVKFDYPKGVPGTD